MAIDAAATERLRFSVLGCSVQIDCHCPDLVRALHNNYSAFSTDSDDSSPFLHYHVGRSAGTDRDGRPTAEIILVRNNTIRLHAESLGEFLYLLEKDMTIELQKQLKDLYFIHAAVLARDNRAVIITAPSGTGKSTSAWALVHHGFRYLSDELAPIDLATLQVSGYPRALGLKDIPPVYALPEHYLDTGNCLHLPVSSMPEDYSTASLPIAAIFTLEYCPEASRASIQAVSKSTAAMHIYANTLNALAHEDKGLEAATAIAAQVPCFHLKSTPDLAETCAALLTSFDER